MSVFAKATVVTESTRNSLPALKTVPAEPRSAVPSATRGMLCGPRSRTFRLPTNRPRPRRRILRWYGRPCLLRSPGRPTKRKGRCPDAMGDGKYTKNSQRVRRSYTAVNLIPVGEGPRDQGRSDDGEHHLIDEEDEDRDAWWRRTNRPDARPAGTRNGNCDHASPAPPEKTSE